MNKHLRFLHLIIFIATSVTLVGLQQKTLGFALLALGLATLPLTDKDFRKHFLLVYFSLLVLGLTPIGTTTALPQALYMFIGLFLVVFVPFIVTRKFYKNKLINYPNLRDMNWPKSRTFYLLFAAIVGYLLLPAMLRSTNSYVNWQLEPGFWDLTVAYIGLNAVGIWDELFFVLTILAILRNYFPFYIANAAQAVLFTAFLYTLGFEGWCVVVIYIFALAQGLVFRQTKSVLYILSIHLTIDLVLHLALVYLHFPWLFPYFIT